MGNVIRKISLAAAICMGVWLYDARAQAAQAAYLTGDDLLKACQGAKPQDISGCLNYIAGVIDYHVMMQSLGTTPTTDFCLPEDLPLDKAAVAVMIYLKKSRQHDSFIAAPAVTMALHETFPCGPVLGHKAKKKK